MITYYIVMGIQLCFIKLNGTYIKYIKNIKYIKYIKYIKTQMFYVLQMSKTF